MTQRVGFAGVYDLSGNVWEWEDRCNGAGPVAICDIRGGSVDGVGNDLSCGGVGVGSPRNSTDDNIGFRMGFRCCGL